jgi:hypothetical protein
MRFPPNESATTPVAIAVRFTFPTNQTFPRSRDLPKRSAWGTKSTLRVSTWEGANALFDELIDSPYRYPDGSGHKENGRTQEGLCLGYRRVFLINLSVNADYFAANALINSYITCDAAMPVIWA